MIFIDVCTFFSRSAPPLFRSALFVLAAFDWAGLFESHAERKRFVSMANTTVLWNGIRNNSLGSFSSWCQVHVPAMQGEFLQPPVPKNAQRGPAPSDSSIKHPVSLVKGEYSGTLQMRTSWAFHPARKMGRSFGLSTSASLFWHSPYVELDSKGFPGFLLLILVVSLQLQISELEEVWVLELEAPRPRSLRVRLLLAAIFQRQRLLFRFIPGRDHKDPDEKMLDKFLSVASFSSLPLRGLGPRA